MSLFTKEGFKALRWVYGVALAGIGVAGFLVGGSYFYWQLEKKDDQASVRTLQDIRARLENAKRERDDLRDSEQTFKVLTARGVFLPEQRLDLIEALAALKVRHKLVTLEYEVAPQRALKLSGAASLPAIDAMGSRIKFKVRAYHDGDLIAFLEEFPRLQRGFFPLDRCTIKRINEAERQSAAPPNPIGQATFAAQSQPQATGGKSPESGEATIEAECTMEWITLRDKRSQAASGPPAAQPS